MATLSLMTYSSLFTHRHKWLQLQQHHSPHKFSRFRASSINKPRKVKTNAELCEDIREFVAATGLPEGYVPTMKDFSQHGRSDLAYVVRRRGYKVIGKLLGSAKETGSGLEKAGENKKGQYEEPKTIVGEDFPLSVDVLSMGNSYDSLVMNSDVESEGKEDMDGGAEMVNVPVESANCLPLEGETLQDGHHDSYNTVEEVAMPSVPVEPSSLYLEEKAASFIEHGNIDTDEENSYLMQKKNGIEATERNIKRIDADEVQIGTSSVQLQNVLSGGNAATNFTGSALQSMQVVTAMTGNKPLRDENLSVEQQSTQFSNVVNDKTSNEESYNEANHLKFMLDKKELELSRLREEIEKEKRALALLQAKAETEIKKAQKLISEKDAELQAAEDMLSELVEVLIQYRGDGEFVEVAGSFNGWHHWVKMDPQPSSNDEDNVEFRNSRLWSTVLWLYPGIYEIKFIVDGQWKNDPTMELVSHGNICNNILRVC